MKQLLEAGVHFGHQTKRWNPKMKRYIFTARNGIYIIDLQQTVRMFRSAYDVVRDMAAEGRTILFVGTKKQAQEAVEEEARRAGTPYVNQRWLGGMLTNFQTIRKSLDRLQRLKEMSTDGTAEKPPRSAEEGERLKMRRSGGIQTPARPTPSVVDPPTNRSRSWRRPKPPSPSYTNRDLTSRLRSETMTPSMIASSSKVADGDPRGKCGVRREDGLPGGQGGDGAGGHDVADLHGGRAGSGSHRGSRRGRGEGLTADRSRADSTFDQEKTGCRSPRRWYANSARRPARG
jgi:hypothetical protein